LKAKLAHVASRQGNHARALALVRSALEAPNVDPLVKAILEARAALSLCALGQLHEADERIPGAVAVTDGLADHEALELTLAASGTLNYLRGDLHQARVLLERGDVARGPTLSSEASNDVRIELANTCYALGDVDAAMRIVDEILALGGSSATSDTPDMATLGEADPLADHLPRAAGGRDARDRWSFVNAEVLLGRVLLERGLIDRARGHLDDAVVRAQRIGAREVVPTARLYRASGALAAGRPAEAAELARAVIAAAEALKLRPLVCEAQAVLSAALVQTGGFAEAAEVARESVVRARTLHLRIHEAVSRRALGLALVRTGDVLQGRKHLETAATAFEQMGAQIDWAKTLLAQAELDSSSDDFTDTRTLRARLKQVVDLTTQLRLDADRAVALNLSAQLSN
jgi:tetratricopeptide (TPR) repeat protein